MPEVITPSGHKVAYQTAGRGEPLVLLAGQANSHRWWDPVRSGFEDDHTTITFDYLGTGDSDKPDIPYGTRGFAADVIAILDDLGIDRAHVYGTSMGGRVAQWVAAEHAVRVRSLILGCTSPGGPHAVERGDEVRRSLAQPDRAAATRALLELMYTPEWLAAHPGPHHTTGDPSMPAHARRRHLRASAAHDAWEALPSITAPTLVIHGTDDLFNPAANAPLIAGRIPGAVRHLIRGARHAYFEEFAAEASPVALDFLAG
ncbi:alpha/beta hydrolase [Nonomuraea sp. NBC_01738]|uniref:alpha/beta fold hydrolase n=1 Tax=Nonomuraea sp. NBC_01738 TaxID=2976003 RepID=UPI002E0D318D|nr:alpha/beta hydrolase [Nonomuraea sp. NBC_01738]